MTCGAEVVRSLVGDVSKATYADAEANPTNFQKFYYELEISIQGCGGGTSSSWGIVAALITDTSWHGIWQCICDPAIFRLNHFW